LNWLFFYCVVLIDISIDELVYKSTITWVDLVQYEDVHTDISKICANISGNFVKYYEHINAFLSQKLNAITIDELMIFIIKLTLLTLMTLLLFMLMFLQFPFHTFSHTFWKINISCFILRRTNPLHMFMNSVKLLIISLKHFRVYSFVFVINNISRIFIFSLVLLEIVNMVWCLV